MCSQPKQIIYCICEGSFADHTNYLNYFKHNGALGADRKEPTAGFSSVLSVDEETVSLISLPESWERKLLYRS